MPLTVTRRKPCFTTGLASALKAVLDPKFLVGRSDSTKASATTLAAGGAGGAGAQVQSDLQRPGQAASAVPSHCSLPWFTRPSPHPATTGQSQAAVTVRVGLPDDASREL